MSESSREYDPTEGTSPDLTGAPDAPGADDLEDLPLEAEVADVLEQRTGVTADAQEHRGRESGVTGTGDLGGIGDGA